MISNQEGNDFVQIWLKSDDITRFLVPYHIAKCGNFGIHLISFIKNYKTVKADWNNNILYLTPLYSMLLPDSYLDVDTLNRILTPLINTKYYKIVMDLYDTKYNIVLYDTSNDRALEQNGTILNVSTLSVLNQEIYSGLINHKFLKL